MTQTVMLFLCFITCTHVFFVAVCVRSCVCAVLGVFCVYLAVEIRGVYTGFYDVEQRVNQAVASAQLLSGLLTGRTQVPLKINKQKRTRNSI